MGDKLLHNHYEAIASSYDSAWGPLNPPELIRDVVTHLGLDRQSRVLDIGAGTGLVAARIAAELRPIHPIICLDPNHSMIQRMQQNPHLIAVRGDVEHLTGALCGKYAPFTAVLMKDVIHHSYDIAQALAQVLQVVAPGGTVLVVMTPRLISYPLFSAARELYALRQPDPASIAASIISFGARVSRSAGRYDISLPASRYADMIRNRFLSVLSRFSNQEIEHGISELGINSWEHVILHMELDFLRIELDFSRAHSATQRVVPLA